jgi:hypothetical protein
VLPKDGRLAVGLAVLLKACRKQGGVYTVSMIRSVAVLRGERSGSHHPSLTAFRFPV